MGDTNEDDKIIGILVREEGRTHPEFSGELHLPISVNGDEIDRWCVFDDISTVLRDTLQ